MERQDFGACKAVSPNSSSTEIRTPNENDLLITRLVARIAELEEKLYKKELDAPAIAQRSPFGSSDGSGLFPGEQEQQQQLLHTPGAAAAMPAAMAPRFRDSLLATLRESWAKLEAHAGGGGIAAAAAAAVAGPPPAAMPMRSLDMVSPTKAHPPGAGAASVVLELGECAKAGGGGARGGGLGAPDGAMSREEVQAGSFNFSTHLVVDYTKPTRGSPSPAAKRRQAGGRPRAGDDGTKTAASGTIAEGDDKGGHKDGEEDGVGADRAGGNDGDDDGDSLSSVDSSGMGYDTAAEELERERNANSRARQGMMMRSVTNSGSGAGPGSSSVPSTPKNGVTAAEGGGGRRPPLPPSRPLAGGSRSGSEGGVGAAASAPAPSLQQQQQPSQPPQPSQLSGMPSRAAAWSGSVLSKLGLPWGRGGGGGGGATDPRDAFGRNASASGGMMPYPPFRGASDASFSDRALEEQLAAGGDLLGPMRGGDAGDNSRYYRYVFDPADVQAEMEVTARVRRAAAEALMEANAKLAEAQAAAAALQQQVEQAKQLEQELEVLRAERSAAQSAKAALEDDMAAVRRQLEDMKDTETSLQSELEGVRSQADIWLSSQGGESEKLKQENTLLRSQLTNRLSELQSCRQRLSDGEAERQRLQREAEELRNKIQWLTKINLQLETAASQLNDARSAATEWQERFMRERNVRRRLHDQLQQLRGNIRVMCRVRPVQLGQRDIVSYPLEGLMGVSPPDRRYQEFEFDHVFPPASSQSAVFEEAVAALVRSVADGHNAAIFAYGQTGSGKTHTMQGPPEDPGIYVRALRELFRIASEEDGVAALTRRSSTGSADAAAIAAAPAAAGADDAPEAPAEAGTDGSTVAAADGAAADAAGATVPPVAAAAAATAAAGAATIGRYSFQVSMLEIYNEAVYDLLAPGAGTGEAGAAPSKPLEVSGLGAGELPPGHARVSGLTWRPVCSTEGVEALLAEGGANRATAATTLNAHSSRSHAMLSVRVTVTRAGDGRRVVSELHLVDLAGSERVDKSEVTGQQLKEAQSINRSLSALGDVVAALQRRSPHIPFRNSKLTAVLQDSLYGNSKVLLVCNIAPESTSASETVSSLNFASRAAQVELSVAARRSASADRSRPSPSPHDRDRALQTLPPPERDGSGGGVVVGRSGGGSGIIAALPSSPLHSQPPLPIMNGTAAKVRAAAAAAAAAAALGAAASGGGGGGSGGGMAMMRSSQSFSNVNWISGGGASSSGGGGGGGSSRA